MIEIYHVSDLHIGKNTRKAKLLLKKIKNKFNIGEHENRYLLVTGDIVQDGRKRQFERAKRALLPFKEKVHVAPGNHDYGFMGFMYSIRSAKNFDDILCQELDINHTYFPKDPYSKTLEDSEGNRVLLIGLNSCSKTPLPFDIAEGIIGDNQRNDLEQILNNLANQNMPKIVFLHHIPHRRAYGIGMSLKDYKKLMRIVRNRVDVLAFGHEGKIKDLEEPETEKLKFSDKDISRLSSVKQMHIPIRIMKLRRGTGQGIRYYLDANKSVNEQACYRIRIEGDKVSARLMRLD
jgi:predicted MPP superfamily phosphohydrolase